MRLGQWIGFFAFVISVYILWEIRQAILLVFASVVLATVLNPVVQRLQQYRIKRGIAIAITFIVLLTLIIGFFVVIVPRIAEQLQELVDTLPQISERLRAWFDWLESVIPEPILEQIRGLENLPQQLQSWLAWLLDNFFVLLNNSFTALLSLLLFFVLSIMLLASPSQYRRVFVRAFPAFYRRRVEEILSECENSLVGWIRGTLLTMVVIAVVSRANASKFYATLTWYSEEAFLLGKR